MHQQSVRGRSSWHPHAHYSVLESCGEDVRQSQSVSLQVRLVRQLRSSQRKTPPGKAGFSAKDSFGGIGGILEAVLQTLVARASGGVQSRSGRVGLAEMAMDRLRSSALGSQAKMFASFC